MNDLASFLEAIRKTPEDDTARLVFADWLDENHPAIPLTLGVLPDGFLAYWREHGVGLELQDRLGYKRPSARGRWTAADIIQALTTIIAGDAGTFFDCFGSAQVGDQPALAFEPNLDEVTALQLCRELQSVIGRCPVSLSRQATTPGRKLRVVVWFNAMPTQKALLSEIVNRLPSFKPAIAATNPERQPPRPAA